MLDAEGGGATVGGLGSWDFGERWVDLIDAVGAGGRQCPPSGGVSASGHHRGQGVVGTSGRGSGEDQERAGLFVLHPEFGHLAGLWSVTGAHEGEQSALTWKPWPLCRQRQWACQALEIQGGTGSAGLDPPKQSWQRRACPRGKERAAPGIEC